MARTQRVVERRGANHGLHVFLSIVTCGLWMITGWPIATMMGRKTVTRVPVPSPQAPPMPPYGYPVAPPQQYGQQPPQQPYGQPGQQPQQNTTWGQQQPPR